MDEEAGLASLTVLGKRYDGLCREAVWVTKGHDDMLERFAREALLSEL
jgi:hypothetical protein